MSQEPPASRGFRKIVREFHHGLDEEKAKGDADALAHVYRRAQEAGATPEQLSRISSGFDAIADELVRQGPKRRRAPWRRRRASEPEPARLAARPPRRELPPGA